METSKLIINQRDSPTCGSRLTWEMRTHSGTRYFEVYSQLDFIRQWQALMKTLNLQESALRLDVAVINSSCSSSYHRKHSDVYKLTYQILPALRLWRNLCTKRAIIQV